MRKLFIISAILFVFASNTVSASPTAYYKFDGNTLDSSGNAQHATTVGSPTYSSGVSNTGLDFNGINEYAVIPNSNLLNSSTFTVGFWWQFDNVNSDYNNPIVYTMVEKRNTNSIPNVYDGNFTIEYYPYNFKSGPYTGNTLRAVIGDGVTESTVYNDNINLVADNFYFITATYDQTQLSIYLDGLLVGQLATTITDNVGDGNIYIGHDTWPASNYYADAIIDELVFYDYALSANEIEAWHQNGAPVPEPATMLLLGTGLVGLVGARRKIKK